MKVSSEELNLIKNNIKARIKIGDTYYFPKKCNSTSPYSELIGEKLAKLLGIKCAHYEFVKDREEIYYLSEDFGNKYKFISGFEFQSKIPTRYNTEKYSLYEIWHEFEEKFSNSQELVLQMIKIYLYDIMFLNFDRNSSNWVILNDNGTHSIAIFDNEGIFTSYGIYLSSNLNFFEEIKSKHKWKDINKYDKEVLDNLEQFLSQSSEEFISLFENMLMVVTPEILESVLTEVEKETGDSVLRKSIMKKYTLHYERMTILLEDTRKRKMH